MGILKCCGKTDSNIEMAEKDCDKTDEIPNSYHVTCLDLGSLLYSIIFHLVDVVYDIYIAYSYFESGEYSYFAWSMALILLPSLIIALISIRMYVEDIKDSASFRHSLVRIVLCAVGIILQSAPLIRNCDSLYYAIKSLRAECKSDRRQQEKYYTKMRNEDSDVALLRVFEAYLESAPQQVLQITLFVVDYSKGHFDHTTRQIVTIVLGFLSVAWCMANYNRCIRFDQEDKKNISAPGMVLQFFWHFNFTVSRIVAVSATAALYTFWTLIAVVIHWCAMTIWLAVSTKTNFCGKHKIFEIFFSSTFGLIYIFNFINVKDGPTKKYYLVFFLVCAVENVIAATIWGIEAAFYFSNWIYYVFMVFPIVGFILSVIFIVVYYNYQHPSRLKSGIGNDKKVFYNRFMQSNTHKQGHNLHNTYSQTLTDEIDS